MIPSQQKILDALRQSHLSLQRLAKATGLSKDSIRGRISELRKQGYDIEKVDGKYQLYLGKVDPAQAILDYVDQYNRNGIILHIDSLSSRLELSSEQVVDGLAQLFKREYIDVLQMSKNTVKIYRRKSN